MGEYLIIAYFQNQASVYVREEICARLELNNNQWELQQIAGKFIYFKMMVLQKHYLSSTLNIDGLKFMLSNHLRF